MRKEEEERKNIDEEEVEVKDERDNDNEVPEGYERMNFGYEVVEDEEEDEEETTTFDTRIADAQLKLLEDDYARCIAMTRKVPTTVHIASERKSISTTETTETTETTKNVPKREQKQRVTSTTSLPPQRPIPISNEKADLIREIMKDVNINKDS
jgi:hypothetical protein